jgi:hypothetical protein
MKRRREIHFGRMLLAFLLANLIFLGVFLISFYISYQNYEGIAEKNNIIFQDLEKMDNLLKTSSVDCNPQYLSEPSEILDKVGSKISILETRFGKDDPRVLEQKSLYNELEIKHFELVKKMDKLCPEKSTTIFFFYSNEEDLEEESERMGFILSTYKKFDPERIMIYSFDYNMQTDLLSNLKKEHEVAHPPAIIVNEKDQFYLQNIDQLEKYLP